jgi:hypothetical protein
MRRLHLVAYRVRGIALAEGDELVIVHDDAAGITVTLTGQLDVHVEESDRAAALASLLLRGILGEPPETLEPQLAESVAEERKRRQREYSAGPFLLFVREDVADQPQGTSRETDKFVVMIDGVDKEAVRETSAPHLARILSAMALASADVIGLDKVLDSVLLYRDDGKPVFAYSITGGNVTAYISRRIVPATVASIAAIRNALIKAKQLERVVSLMTISMEPHSDALRAFLAAWTALEILVSKLFPEYEAALFSSLHVASPQARRDYWDRIRDVMKDKYRLTDKFLLIASVLAPATADEDRDVFDGAKRLRDKLLHGVDVPDDALQVQPILDLLRRYLRLHLESATA